MFYSTSLLNECHFWVPCIPVWHPKLFVRESDDNPHRFTGSKLIKLGTLVIKKCELFDEKYSNFTTTHKRIQISEKCIGHGVGKPR